MMTMLHQMDLIENRDLGYSQDNIVTIKVKDEKILNDYQPFRNEIIQNPNVKDVTSSFDLPTSVGSGAFPSSCSS